MILLSLIGVVISLYSFLHNQGFASGEFCKINDSFNCDVVNKGPYSAIAGVPVSIIGVIGYAFIALGAFLKWRQPDDRSLNHFLLFATVSGFLFSLYLSGLEAFVLDTWCLVCLTSQVNIILLMILATILNRKL
jgi:uncharacterized membrane protein